MGNNSCDINLKKYKDFKVQIYNSNYISKEDNNNSKLDISECENILKEKYNIPINENLTIFKIDYNYENLKIPIMEYKLYYKDKLLNLSYCDGVGVKISTKINFENYNIDFNKINDALKSNIDVFNKSSQFYNDICSTFTNSNGTDVPIKDRKKDYYPNISLCQEGCTYDGFDKQNYEIKCVCNNNISNENSNEFNENDENLFSNSNIKVLKCIYLYINIKNFLNNYGSFIFLFCEMSEIFLIIFNFIKGYVSIMKSLNILHKNIYFKNNPVKKNFFVNSSLSFSSNKSIKNLIDKKDNNLNKKYFENKSDYKFKSKKDINVIIYKKIELFEENNIIDSKNKFIYNNEKKTYVHQELTDEEINELDFNKSLILEIEML